MQATKIATYRDKYFTTIEYEYRGHSYDVTYPNGWQVCCTPAHIQHRDAQERIDREIEREIELSKRPKIKQKSAQEVFDEWWDMMQNGWEE
jgi:hypothetical protein